MKIEMLNVYCVFYQVVNVIDFTTSAAYTTNELVYQQFIKQMDLRYNHPRRPEDQNVCTFIVHDEKVFRVLNDGTGAWRNVVHEHIEETHLFKVDRIHSSGIFGHEINYVLDRRTGQLVTYLDSDLEEWGESGSYAYPHPNGAVIDLVTSLALVVEVCANLCIGDCICNELVIQLGRLVLAYVANSDFAKFILDGDESIVWDTIMGVYPPFRDPVERDERIAEYESTHIVWEPVDELQVFLQEAMSGGVCV